MSARIRACVMDADYGRIFTWYDDGRVITWRRGLDYQITDRGIHTMAQFNEMLETVNVAPLKAKRIMRSTPMFTDEEHAKLDEIPF